MTTDPAPPPSTGKAPHSPVRIRFRGHPAVRATDPRAWEILDTEDWVDRPGALGYAPQFDPAALLHLRGRVVLHLEVEGETTSMEATLQPSWTRGGSLAFRRDTRTLQRPLASQCSKAAADLPAALVDRLRAPGAQASLTLTPLSDPAPPAGSLTLVAMPIGNQGDLPPRALDALAAADLILAEDTRVTDKALRWRGIQNPIASCHDHNERQRAPEALRRLAQGQRLVLVSDAGTPLVSDPGYALVQAALQAGVHLSAIPGPSAVVLALILSGLPADTFRFAGFAPRRSAELDPFLDRVLAGSDTTVLFESAHRIETFLEALTALAPERRIAVCKDLTKRTEHVLRGTPGEVAGQLHSLEDTGGEYTVVMAPAPESPTPASSQAAPGTGAQPALEPFLEALLDEGCPTAPIVKALRKKTAMPRDAAYAYVQGLAKARGQNPPPSPS